MKLPITFPKAENSPEGVALAKARHELEAAHLASPFSVAAYIAAEDALNKAQQAYDQYLERRRVAMRAARAEGRQIRIEEQKT